MAVVEHRLAVERELDLADHAARRAQQDVLGLVVRRRPAVRAGAPLAVIPGPDAHRVADDQPAGACPPGRLEDERARAGSGGRPAPGRPSGRTESCPRARSSMAANTLGLSGRGRHIHSTRPLGAIEAVDLAVGQEGVLGDGRERAGDARPRPPAVRCRPMGVCPSPFTDGANRLTQISLGGLSWPPSPLPRGYADGPPDALENLIGRAGAVDPRHRRPPAGGSGRAPPPSACGTRAFARSIASRVSSARPSTSARCSRRSTRSSSGTSRAITKSTRCPSSASIASSAWAWRTVRGNPSSSTPAPVSASGSRPRTMSTISSSGTRSPAAMIRPGLLAGRRALGDLGAQDRRLSRGASDANSRSMRAACVPLPLPGGPKMMPITA